MIIGVNEKSKCCNRPVKELWRGLKLFHQCTSCGRQREVGRIVYYQDTEEDQNFKNINNKKLAVG